MQLVKLLDFHLYPRAGAIAEAQQSLEMVGCEREILPMVIATVSTAPTLLIFENAAPFMLARRVLSELPQPPIGCVGYGGGMQLSKSIGYFAMIGGSIRDILYVGDLDGEGLQIAADLKKRSTEIPVRPATSFHRAMLESAAFLRSPGGWLIKEEQTRNVPDSSFEFLDAQIRAQVQVNP